MIVEIRGLKNVSVKHTYWEGEVEEKCSLIHKKNFHHNFLKKKIKSKLKILNIKLNCMISR